MNVAVDDAVGVVKNRLRLVGKYNLNLGAAILDQVGVILDVINAGKFMLAVAEQFAIFNKVQHIRVGVDAGLVDLVEGYQRIAHLVAGVAEHEDDLLATLRNTAKHDGEAVAGEDREDDTDGAAAELALYVCCDVVNAYIVALGSCDDGLRQSNDVAVAKCKAFALCRAEHAVNSDVDKVVSLADDAATDASGYSSDSTFHVCGLL